jgi:hypothetical protein
MKVVRVAAWLSNLIAKAGLTLISIGLVGATATVMGRGPPLQQSHAPTGFPFSWLAAR